jgi:hypothetical protein
VRQRLSSVSGTHGTRFRLFPEYAAGYLEPETVVLSPRAGTISAGPSDASMYVANAVLKTEPYDPPDYMPPYRGAVYPAAFPSPDGNFDHIPVDSEQFLAAHLYGCIRFTLDVWERFLGRRIRWWHADFLPQLELIPLVRWRNAHSGPGFIEMGEMPDRTGALQLFCLNYDVVGHETGHAILFAQIGVPPPDGVTSEYLALQESFSDLIGMIGAMEFRSVAWRLLRQTNGNLYVLNLVSRLGELSDREQVRIASNTRTMDDLAGLRLMADGSWFDPLGQNRNQHHLAEPLTGAIFDCMVEIYQDFLVSRGYIRPDDDARGWTRDEVAASFDEVHRMTGRAFAQFEVGFVAALDDARDVVGQCMAHVMLTVRPETVSFNIVAARFLEAAFALGHAHHLRALLDHFLWRGIDPLAYLTESVVRSTRRRLVRPRRVLRAVEPLTTLDSCSVCSNPFAFILARRLMPHAHRGVPS